MWKEAIMAKLKVTFQSAPGVAEENHDKASIRLVEDLA
jgi:hypothetical protein